MCTEEHRRVRQRTKHLPLTRCARVTKVTLLFGTNCARLTERKAGISLINSRPARKDSERPAKTCADIDRRRAAPTQDRRQGPCRLLCN